MSARASGEPPAGADSLHGSSAGGAGESIPGHTLPRCTSQGPAGLLHTAVRWQSSGRGPKHSDVSLSDPDN